MYLVNINSPILLCLIKERRGFKRLFSQKKKKKGKKVKGEAEPEKSCAALL